MSDHDRRDDSQSGAGGTAHQLIVPLYFQRPVAGPKWYSTVPLLAERAQYAGEKGGCGVLLGPDRCVTVSAHDGREIVRTLQRVCSLCNTVLDPMSPVLRDRRRQFGRQAELRCIAIDAGQASRRAVLVLGRLCQRR